MSSHAKKFDASALIDKLKVDKENARIKREQLQAEKRNELRLTRKLKAKSTTQTTSTSSASATISTTNKAKLCASGKLSKKQAAKIQSMDLHTIALGRIGDNKIRKRLHSTDTALTSHADVTASPKSKKCKVTTKHGKKAVFYKCFVNDKNLERKRLGAKLRAKKYRDKRKQDPETQQQQQQQIKEHERYRGRRQSGQIKKSEDLSERGRRGQQKRWKINTRNYREQKTTMN